MGMESNKSPAQPSSANGDPTARILLVEDHEDTRRATARLLALQGFEVAVAGTVAEARDRLNERHFDLLVCDLELPDGSACELMRPRPNGAVAIAVSGHATDEHVRTSKAAGFVEHLIKPVRWEDLLATI